MIVLRKEEWGYGTYKTSKPTKKDQKPPEQQIGAAVGIFPLNVELTDAQRNDLESKGECVLKEDD
jgi:hypothetical protein